MFTIDRTDLEPLPNCSEDVVLQAVPTNRWDCGPAFDDNVWNLETEDCDYLVGVGQFENGGWDEYACAMPIREGASSSTMLPNTSTLPPSGYVDIGPFVVLLILFMATIVGRKKSPKR